MCSSSSQIGTDCDRIWVVERELACARVVMRASLISGRCSGRSRACIWCSIPSSTSLPPVMPIWPRRCRDVGAFGELLADRIAEDEYERALETIEVEQLRSLLSGLSDRERAVLRARYGLDGDEQMLRDVAGRLGLSAERVRQIEQRALAKLRAAVGGD